MLQVTECPSDIKLVTRVAAVNDNDVTIGNSIECDLILTTDQAVDDSIWATIAPANANNEFVMTPHTDDIMLNGRPIINAVEKVLNDGDIVQLEHYTLLFSCEQVPVNATDSRATIDVEVEFDANNILAGLGDKPEETKTNFTSKDQDLFIEYDEIAQADLNHSSVGTPIDAIADKIDHLLEISQNPWIQQKKLLSMLDGVVDEFIKEFEPALIEDMVGKPGLFQGGKQWEAYKKYYQRKHNEGHFKRQFKALLIECLQK